MKPTTVIAALAVFLLAFSTNCPAYDTRHGNVAKFIDQMVAKHKFNRRSLNTLFSTAETQHSILKAISKPAEAMPWYKYRRIFLTESRIDGGVKFWRDNKRTLAAVENRYGVPPEVIVAIIGVETRYGANTGSYRVIDALSTLGFEYPKRATFFRKELEAFLLLCRDEGINPATPKGSYAGAMGFPQFMPSSFRAYAADFDGDKRRDIWSNHSDAIASVANYFAVHGWKPGQAVTFPVNVKGNKVNAILDNDLKPKFTAARIAKYGVTIPRAVAPAAKAKLIKLDNITGPDYWLALHNFYVITRYNHSPLYAMAVYQLSREILEKNKS
ncbi:MAG: lytic murein transglycosylase B [Pseudomonadota bacterium]